MRKYLLRADQIIFLKLDEEMVMKKLLCLTLAILSLHLNAYQVVVTNRTNQLLEVSTEGNATCKPIALKVKAGEQDKQANACCPKEIKIRKNGSMQGAWNTWRRDATKNCNEDDLLEVTEDDQGKLTIKEQIPARGYEVIMNNKTGGMLNIRISYKDASNCSVEHFTQKTPGEQSFAMQKSCCPQTVEVQMMEQGSKNPPKWYAWNKNVPETCIKNDKFEVIKNQDGSLNLKRIGQ